MSARTYLFVPGNRPERFDKALASEADAVVLDLEDAVAPADKSGARQATSERLCAATPEQRARLVVRINDASTPWFETDLAALRSSGATAVMLPKAERPDDVARARRGCPGIGVLALVETARGVLGAEALAQTEGVQRLVFGTIDFALDMDLAGDPIGLDHAASRLALASRSAGLASPVAGVTTAVDDDALLLAELARARAHGFGAKLCIHPKQVARVHAALRPTAAEVDWAQRVLAAAAGSPGSFQFDGRMVDRPVLQRARALLARQAA